MPSTSRIIRYAGAAVIAGLLATGGIAFLGPDGASMFMPHAHCYLFNSGLMWLHGGSDFLIGLSYVAISVSLTYLVLRARKEVPFHWMMLAFATFILACGATHFMEVWTLQSAHPRYWLSGWVKLVTAGASLTTALLLPPLVPRMHGMLNASRLAAERKSHLEHAYAELRDLYEKAVAQASEWRAEQRTHPTGAADHNLALMAKEVTAHAQGLEQAWQQAKAANQAKDRFLAVLSHELRTPLTPALAAASQLEAGQAIADGERSELLALIRRNIELEARLVDDLLDHSRIMRGKLKVHSSTIDLHETVRHALEMCRSDANSKGTDFQVHLAAADRYVCGDGARLAQVFWNLILNAIKFTPAGGRVAVRSSNPAPGTVRVEVEDTGIGIEPAMLSRIFEPFEQGEESTTRRYGGLGLGLTVARGLVEAHGGEISARSRGKGWGAVFQVELKTIKPPVAPAVSAATPGHGPQRPLRILLVEDHQDTQRALERLLVHWGHTVEAVATVTQALQVAEEFRPELLLSDIGLPDGTGMDLLRRLRERGAMAAIAMSGYGMENDLEQSRAAGFGEHLIKPLAVERLQEAILRLAGQ